MKPGGPGGTRVGVISLGCAKNASDTEEMMGALGMAGYEFSGPGVGADARAALQGDRPHQAVPLQQRELGGVVAGLALALNIESVVGAVEQAFGIQFIDPSIYYIAKLPSDVQLTDVTMVGLGSFLLSLLMTLAPAWRAFRTQPAEALRYE